MGLNLGGCLACGTGPAKKAGVQILPGGIGIARCVYVH